MAGQPDDELEAQAERIRRLGERTGVRPSSLPDGADFRGARNGYRLGADFVSTLLTALALGWLVDEVFGFAPWGLLVLTFAGFVLGVFNLWRAVNASSGDSSA